MHSELLFWIHISSLMRWFCVNFWRRNFGWFCLWKRPGFFRAFKFWRWRDSFRTFPLERFKIFHNIMPRHLKLERIVWCGAKGIVNDFDQELSFLEVFNSVNWLPLIYRSISLRVLWSMTRGWKNLFCFSRIYVERNIINLKSVYEFKYMWKLFRYLFQIL